MPVFFVMSLGLFGVISAVTGYFMFDLGLLTSFLVYIGLGGVLPMALVFMNVEEDDTDFVERRTVPRYAS